jgi:uncharacterized protein
VARMIFVNLPVRDLEVATRFYAALGLTPVPDYSDETASCLAVDDRILVMLLTEPKFREFIVGDIADPGTTEVLNCLTVEHRQEVDDLIATAIHAGGKPWKPVLEEGPMYVGTVADPDGHVWEVLAMDHG